jgi:hypothetical protein
LLFVVFTRIHSPELSVLNVLEAISAIFSFALQRRTGGQNSSVQISGALADGDS